MNALAVTIEDVGTIEEVQTETKTVSFFLDTLTAVVKALPKRDPRQVLLGALITKYSIAVCDGKTAFRQYHPGGMAEGMGDDDRFIVPAEFLKDALKIAKKQDSPPAFRFEAIPGTPTGRVFYSWADGEISASLIEGMYPNMDLVIPTGEPEPCRLAFASECMRKALDIFDAMHPDGKAGMFRLDYEDPNKPGVLQCTSLEEQKVTVLLMPCRISKMK